MRIIQFFRKSKKNLHKFLLALLVIFVIIIVLRRFKIIEGLTNPTPSQKCKTAETTPRCGTYSGNNLKNCKISLTKACDKKFKNKPSSTGPFTLDSFTFTPK